jgi:Family of unknown function (DUF5678)
MDMTTLQATMERFVRWIGIRSVSKREGSRTPRRSLRALLAGFDGKWVAISNGEVVAASDTPYALVADLKSRRIENASIIRAPSVGEPEMVAFG